MSEQFENLSVIELRQKAKEMGVKLINLLHYGFGTKEMVATMKVIGQEYIDLGLLPGDFDLIDAENQFLVKYDLTKIQ